MVTGDRLYENNRNRVRKTGREKKKKLRILLAYDGLPIEHGK